MHLAHKHTQISLRAIFRDKSTQGAWGGNRRQDGEMRQDKANLTRIRIECKIIQQHRNLPAGELVLNSQCANTGYFFI